MKGPGVVHECGNAAVVHELSQYVENCGVTKRNVLGVLRGLLSTAVTIADPGTVYSRVCGDLNGHKYRAGKAGRRGEDRLGEYQKRSFPPEFWKQLYTGAKLRTNGKIGTTAFDAFCEKVIEPIAGANFSHSYRLMLFQMLNSRGNNLNALIHDEYDTLGLGLTPSEKKTLSNGMRTFDVREDDKGGLATEISMLIRDTVFPCLSSIEWTSLTSVGGTVGTSAPTFPGTNNGQTYPHLEGQAEDATDLVLHAHTPWTRDDELYFGRDPTLRAYKASRGLPVYFDNHATMMDMIQDAMGAEGDRGIPEPFKALTQAQCQQLVKDVVQRADPAVLMSTQQAKAFYQCMANSVSNYQLKQWTSQHILERMITAHHPTEWKQHWDFRWTPDKTMLGQITAYLGKYPTLNAEFMTALRKATSSSRAK